MAKLDICMVFYFLTEDGTEQQVLRPAEHCLSASEPLAAGFNCDKHVENQEASGWEEKFSAW